MTMLGRGLLLASVLLISGCAGLIRSDPSGQQQAEQAWQAHRASMNRIDHFTLKGRIASSGMLGMKADLLWEQTNDGGFSLRLAGPLGTGAVLIEKRDGLVNVRTREGEFQTDDPEAWLMEKAGWSLPVERLRYWALGLPAPQTGAHIEISANGLVEQLSQDGWTLSYPEYTVSADYQLPKKLEATNGNVKVRILADEWSNLP